MSNKYIFVFFTATILFLSISTASAITFTSFGPHGEGGSLHGQDFSIGAGGSVFEIDGFVNIAGQDLNGSFFGTSAQLSFLNNQDHLPSGLDFSFNPSLSTNAKNLTLSYSFTNNTGGDIANITFLSYLDADIDVSVNGFFNEYVTTSGSPASDENYEVGNASVTNPPIIDHLLEGNLTGVNEFPPPNTGNVAMALSFNLADLMAGEIFTIDILISEDANSIGGFSMTQSDNDPNSSDTNITYSGMARSTAIPEGDSLLLMIIGLLSLMGFRCRTA